MTSSDDALLARLNALRASSVNLSHSSALQKNSNPKPVKAKDSPETHLSSRLKALRTASESNATSVARPSSLPNAPTSTSPNPLSRPVSSGPPSSSPPRKGVATAAFEDSVRQAGELESDIKRTKLFERNVDEDLKVAREAREAVDWVGEEIKTNFEWGDGEKLSIGSGREDDAEGKRLRVLGGHAAAAMERAKKVLARRDDGECGDGDSGSDEDGKPKRGILEEKEESDDDEGEHAERDEDEEAEADAILAELVDDAALDFGREAWQGLHQPEFSSPQLPPPPSRITLVPPSKDTETADQRKGDKGDEENDDAFDRAMNARMLALRAHSPSTSPSLGLELPAAPSTQPVDSLGLPSAPVDKLSSLSVSKQPKEDYICKICYDDATIFCEGCEAEFEEFERDDKDGEKGDAMYCARCWREAHLGETADEAERGHGWVVMRRGR